MSGFQHTTVLLTETVDALGVRPGGVYCDVTLGGAGHARAILERSGPDGRLIGFDKDPAALAAARQALSSFGARVTLHHQSFSELLPTLERSGALPLDGLVADLGVSSHQIDTATRGFSFGADGPIDMRMNTEAPTTAATLIAELSEGELADVLFQYGEEKKSRRVAQAIKSAHARGELETTLQLASVVAAAVGSRPARGQRRTSGGAGKRSTHPATRTFQALRIAVNDELGALERLLDDFLETLRIGGRVAIISFHSLEDRAVKRRFAKLAESTDLPAGVPIRAVDYRPSLRLLTRGAVKASADELANNPRSRSARMRAAERLR